MKQVKKDDGGKPPVKNPEKTNQINIDISKIKKFLLYAFLIQFILNLLVIWLTGLGYYNLYGIGKFNFDFEESVPTYFSSFNLLFTAILLAIISSLKKTIKDSYFIHWGGLSVIFFILSIDEVAGFHELLIDPIRRMYDFTGYLRFPWVIPALLFMVILYFSYFKFLNSLPEKSKIGFLYSGIIFLTGAIGIEMISAKIFINLEESPKDLIYNLVTSIEETLEMLGIILFIFVLLSYLRSLTTEINLKIK